MLLEENKKAAERVLAFRDEEGDVSAAFVQAVSEAVQADDSAHLRDLIADFHEADQGALLEALDADLRPRLIELLGDDFDFAALTEVDDAVREEILEELPAETVAEGVKDLDSDDAVYILEGLDKEDQDEILDALPASERVALQKSLDYPEDSAGRLMQADLIAVPPFWTVGQVLAHLREATELPESFFEIFVVDPGHRLLGHLFLDALLRSDRAARIETLMVSDRRRVRVLDDSEEVARLFQRYNLVSAPVVDEADRLVGVITIDDMVDVLQEEADDEIKALGGVRADEELSDTVLYTTRSRFIWLFVNLLTAFLASSVLGLFEGSLEKMVALAVLAPIVASQGGNAATQTMTVAVRALAMRELGPSNAWRITIREALVGLLNGVGFGLLTGVVASLWFRDWNLGIVICLAMVVNLIAGALGGILIPMALERFRADPAVSSGVFVTTVTDVVGFFSFLGIATLWFGLH
ncbi:magnesium transporter [Alsobacter sp. SYSU M60028]|uniref:Magnesium transporter MgtE n=1 Tax=Alsobacter ponti TaxID=2962936 RepID=A0ABT1LC71_9HYPH|nr:magnesium transporter [Alsobacter ponti]MCP8939024.1 magnesium transporter [Alsobacter ponti]